MYGASTKEQASQAKCVWQLKGKWRRWEAGVALKHPSLLTTLMVAWTLLSGLRVVYVLGRGGGEGTSGSRV